MSGGLQLHLGCGKRHIPGFIHIDIADYDHVDYQASVDNLYMIEDKSCSLIYASHVLTYFDRTEAREVLTEWNRVLKKGGLLRIAVPDFDKQIEVYKMTGEDMSRIQGALYGKMEISVRPGWDKKVIYIKACYNFSSLKKVLEECGFVNIRRYNWWETVHKNYDDFSQAYYPHMDKENGLLRSMNVEADKV